MVNSLKIELPSVDPRLKRHINHDPRSAAYRLDVSGLALTDVEWALLIPRLNQQDVGKCTAEAATECIGSAPFFDTLPAGLASKLNDTWSDSFYHDETKADDYKGTWPPDDTGSDGLTSAKVMQTRGLISGYEHTFTTDDALKAIQLRPGSWGTIWKSGMDDVNTDTGQVKYSGTPRGGHQLSIFKIVVATEQVWFHNHWGPWGYRNSGDGWISFDDFDKSLGEQGDVTFYVPLDQPAPTPTPSPTPTPVMDPIDVPLLNAGNAWEPSIFSRITKAGKFKLAFEDWKTAKGYKP